MTKYLLSLLLLLGNNLFSQTLIKPDPEIAAMVNDVSSDSLQSYVRTLVSFGTRSTLSNQGGSKKGIGAARNWVLKEFKDFAARSAGRMSAFIDTVTIPPGARINRPLPLGNVVAELKGTDPDDHRIFIISGHLDSRRSAVMDSIGDAPGADDDGSGTAAVVECARIMSRHSFPATVIFVAVSGEEQGLYGSAFMAGKAAKAHWDIRAVLNNDIIGGNNSSQTGLIDNTRVRVFSEGIPAGATAKEIARIRALGLENDSRSRELARYIREICVRYIDHLEVKLIYRTDRFLRGGDHIPFLEKGFTAVRITEMNENFNHQHQDVRMEKGVEMGDLPQFLDYEYLRKNTALNLASLASLAKAPPEPVNVKIDVRGLSNTSTFTWDAPPIGDAAGYYLFLRESSSPVWQKKIFTTGTSITVPYSKDNYLFAVASVDGSGNESLPVIPGI